jgi:hypothetical protein
MVEPSAALRLVDALSAEGAAQANALIADGEPAMLDVRGERLTVRVPAERLDATVSLGPERTTIAAALAQAASFPARANQLPAD